MMKGETSQVDKTPESISLAFSAHEAEQQDVNADLVYYREWIFTLVQQQVQRSGLPAEEVDDLTQIVLITFWLISKKVRIAAPKAYIRSIVRSRAIDRIRRQQAHRMLPMLSLERDVELTHHLLISHNEMQNPAFGCEHREFLERVVEKVLRLPPCQQQAMICTLKDEVGETYLLIETFLRHGVDIRDIRWPQDAVALQNLKGSLAPARKKLRVLRE